MYPVKPLYLIWSVNRVVHSCGTLCDTRSPGRARTGHRGLVLGVRGE